MSNVCKYCFCIINYSSELTHLIKKSYTDNSDIIVPCGCECLAHKSCLIQILNTKYRSECEVCSEPFNLSFLEKAGCIIRGLQWY